MYLSYLKSFCGKVRKYMESLGRWSFKDVEREFLTMLWCLF